MGRKQLGVDVVLDYRKVDAVAEIRRLTGGVNVAIEALGTQQAFESVLRVLTRSPKCSELNRRLSMVLATSQKPYRL